MSWGGAPPSGGCPITTPKADRVAKVSPGLSRVPSSHAASSAGAMTRAPSKQSLEDDDDEEESE
eukprot:5964005-Amphidinium_carterae.1